MDYILNYDLFVFDFDGTLIDTEKYHCDAWSNAIADYKNKTPFSYTFVELKMSEYQKYFHTLNSDDIKLTLKLMYEIEDYDEIYKIKQKYYEKFIVEKKFNFINGAEQFLNFLIKNNKKFIIVSNTSQKNLEEFKKKFPILNNVHKIYTKEYFLNRKPNPECYLKIVHEYKNSKIIGFEDSLVGLHALYQVNEITPVLIDDKTYFHRDYMIDTYKNLIVLNDYNILDLDEKIKNHIKSDNIFINSILNNNITQLQNNFENMKNIINNVSILINNVDKNSHIYLSGMGKSGYVCKKSASTWQSLSIKCSYIDLPNLPHGDFGLFNDNDIFILISNGGNTEEIIYILKYIKNNLKKKINTISIVANENTEMEKYSNFTFILNNIKESDNINMTPSTSSLIFMALLDGISINVKKNITKEDFQLVHPGGSLGKK